MATRSPKSATYADLEALPPEQIGQIIDGELFAMPRPATPHAMAITVLGAELVNPFGRGKGGPGGWVLLYEPELHLGADVLVPDWAGWRRERMPEMPVAAFITLAPDWVCEVISPSSHRVDRIKKPRIYAREHIPHYWLVDPTMRTLEVLKLDGETYRLVAAFADEERVRAEPFDAIEIALADLWTV